MVNFKDVFNNRSLNTNNLTGKVNVNSKELKNYSVEKGDVFFTRTSEVIGEIGYPSVILNDPENTVFSGFVLRGRPKSGIDLINNNFKRYVFFTNSFRKEMITKSSMTTRALTSGSAINKMKVIYPVSAKEQRKIGDFFSKLDRQIELEEQKLELLQQQKKGYMQKIFSQELRFKDENGNDYPNWEEKKIEDIASQVYGGGTPNTKIKEFWNGDIPWIQSSDVKVNDLILRQCNKFISKNSIELSSAKLIPANSIAIVTRVGVGKLCLVEFDYATSQDFLSLSSLKYDKLYSLYSLLYTMKKISANLQGTSIKGITKKELLDSIIKIPHNLEEQQKIGDLFYKIDKYISFNKCKIEILKSLKQGLLQKIFI
ncbi:TPA: restriction endonuclease subunit S [Staphylococcus aureus]|nr:restriction endonuclease subunit S [Staphylococcus aureus]